MIRSWWTRGSSAERAGCGFLSGRQLEAALGGALGAKHRAAFDAHRLAGCAPCTFLAADLAVYGHVATHGLLASERREFERTRATLASRLRQELDAARPAPAHAWSWRPAALAAAAVLTLAIVTTPLLRRGDGGPVVIDGATFEPMAFSAPPPVRGASLDELWREAARAYGAGAYDDAEAVLAEIVERDPSSHDARLYRGVSLVMLERHADALEVLGQARRLAEQAGLATGADEYWSGAAALGSGDAAAARAAFERARAGGGPFAARAAVALEAIAAR